jgi:hypothetical protein
MTEKIETLHPERGKKGVNIDRVKYDQMRSAILASFQRTPQLTLKELEQSVTSQLKDSFDGSIMWYLMSVKLDLEARRVVQRVPFTQPPRLRLKSTAK